PAAEPGGSGVGSRLPRLDAREKVLGYGQYVDDKRVSGMLHGAALRARYPRALVKSIDTAGARALPGVAAVLTAADIPGQRFLGHIVPDWPALIATGEETRYVGDALALVAADSREIARAALDRIRVEYEELSPLTTPEAALADGAPALHPGGNILSRTVLKRGDAEEAIARAAHAVTQVYSTPPTEHAFLEPESALAVPDGDGGLIVYTGTQSVYDDHHGIVALLGLAPDKVRVVSGLVGGGFGGKEDLSVQHHAALLAWHSRRPVKMTLSRPESMAVHPKRHPMTMEFTTACDGAGRLTAVKARLVADTGAYASLGGPVLQRACTHAAGPYEIANVDITGLGVYTNNPPAGAFRGFGVTQSCFAMESNLNLLADQLGLSPWEIRFRNAIEPGKVLPNGQIADPGTALKETLLAVRDVFEAYPDAGIACAMKNSGLGVGVPDVGRVRLCVRRSKIVVATSAACMGQGLATTLGQIVCQTLGLDAERLEIQPPDTLLTPDGGTSTASRQTLFNGEAARQAALALGTDLADHSLEELEGREYYGEYRGDTDPMGSAKLNPVSHVAYSYATQVAVLDEAGKVAKLIAAHDVGRAINPTSLEGQIEGGVVMGLGYALTEDFPLQNGRPTARFGTLGLWRATDIPEIICRIIEKNPSPLAYGAKGIGEIAAIPAAPAVAGAYFRRDKKVRTSLPLPGTPYRRQ
ncbi:MAG TPA: selenium-dependent xanthine dehydrogenase, partial [Selenomonadales bacterium]|nr:selenium-dependent xanthine dehydrogenase [Selenomonadales bacterium]